MTQPSVDPSPTGDRPIALYCDAEGIQSLRDHEAIVLLESAGFDVRMEVGTTTAELREHVAKIRPYSLSPGLTQVTEEVLTAADSLRIVNCASVGFDYVDLAAAERLGIWVSHVPDAATEEVASHALAMALGLAREIPFLDRHVREGGWSYEAAGTARRLSQLTLGVIGMGRIGRRLAGLADGVFGRVVGCDPFIDDSGWPADVERVELDPCIEGSDVISLHVPLTPETEKLIDAATLARMIPGSYLVNVSRGGLIDQEALLAALDGGRLAGAALDVTDPEPPPPDDPVRTHRRIVVNPHSAWSSEPAMDGYVIKSAENVIALRNDGRPRNAVNDPHREAVRP